MYVLGKRGRMLAHYSKLYLHSMGAKLFLNMYLIHFLPPVPVKKVPTYRRVGLLVDVEIEASVAEDAEPLLPRLRSAVQLEEEPAAVRQQRRELVGGVSLALPGNLQPEVVLIDVKRYTCRNRGTVANFGENCLIVTF